MQPGADRLGRVCVRRSSITLPAMVPRNPGLSKGCRATCRTAGLADLGMAIDAETHSTQAGTMARCIGNVIYVLQARPGMLSRLRAACGRPFLCHSETLSSSLCMLSTLARVPCWSGRCANHTCPQT